MTDLELLGQLEAMVRPHVEKVSLRGEGCSSFLFIESGGRAIEASRHEAKWWLEFWNSREEDAAGPARELTLESSEGALLAIRDWVK
jgi:hypothetical protein